MGNSVESMDSESNQIPPEEERDLFGLAIADYEHHWTGERVRERRPETYRAIIGLLGCNLPVVEIARQLGVSEHTVRVVRNIEAVAVADRKREYGQRLRRWGAIAFAHAMSRLHESSSRDAAVVGGILDDHAGRLMGEATAIVEHKRSEVNPQQAAAWWRSRVIEVSASPAAGPAGGAASESGSESQALQTADAVAGDQSCPPCATDQAPAAPVPTDTGDHAAVDQVDAPGPAGAPAGAPAGGGVRARDGLGESMG